MDNLVLGRLLHGEDVVVAERGVLSASAAPGTFGLLLDRNGCVRSAERFTRERHSARRRFVTESWETMTGRSGQLTGHMLACTLTAPRRATVLRPTVGTATLVREADMVMADMLNCLV